MKRTVSKTLAFTLIEVVVALGIFAGGIITVIALIGPLNRAAGEVSGANGAAGLGPAIQIELERLRDEITVPVGQSRLDQLAVNITGANPVRFIATKDSTHIVDASFVENDPITATPRGIALNDRYYYIQVSPQSAPLDYTAGDGFLAVSLLVSWPYQIAIGDNPEQASVLILNAALTP